jgi:hypothetical protein
MSKKRALVTHWIGGLGPKIILDVLKKIDLAKFDSLTAVLPKFQFRILLLVKHLFEYQTLTTKSAVCNFTD